MSVQAACEFLGTATPEGWLSAALGDIETLLIDHANCEKKAAGSALNLLYRYVDRDALLPKLSKLAREELRHFEQVLGMMRRRGVRYRHLSPSRYAGSLHKLIANHEPLRLVDTLIVGAVVEARSCERFALLADRLDDDLGAFYGRLLASEARHFEVYLDLAEQHADNIDLGPRLALILDAEAQLVASSDAELRFHSGVPS